MILIKHVARRSPFALLVRPGLGTAFVTELLAFQIKFHTHEILDLAAGLKYYHRFVRVNSCLKALEFDTLQSSIMPFNGVSSNQVNRDLRAIID